MEIIKTNVVARTVAQLTQFSSGLDKIEIWISLASIGLDMKTINVIGEHSFLCCPRNGVIASYHWQSFHYMPIK